mgnify:FL=1
MIGYLYGGYTTGLNYNQLAWVYNISVELKERWVKVVRDRGLMDQYTAYVAYNDKQDIVWIEKDQKGSLNLKKESANPEMTDGTVVIVRRVQSMVFIKSRPAPQRLQI